MKFTTTHSPARRLVGVSMRTSHAKAMEDIPAFWQRVMSQQTLSAIESKTPGAIYAVYKDMEDEWRGAYTMMLAVEVSSETDVPAGFEQVKVASSKRTSAVLEDNRPESIGAAWQHIWYSWERREQRAYGVDLEIHRMREDGSGEVEISLTMRDQAG